MADHPFSGAGPDMVEALLRGAMNSPHVAADPVGGQAVARLFQQLAQTDSSRVGRLLSPQPGPAQFEVEVHRTGDIVPESVIRDLSAGGAIREAFQRAGDPSRSVELVVVPTGAEDEVVLAARPGQPLTYLFTDDVRAKAAALPPPARPSGPPTGPVPIPQSRADSEHAYDSDSDIRAHDPSPAASPAGLVPMGGAGVAGTSGSHAVTAGELTAAIEAALAEMSIQVDVAGVAELVQEAVVDHLRNEVGLGAGYAGGAVPIDASQIRVDTAAIAEQLATLTGSNVPAEVRVDTAGIAQQVAMQVTDSLAGGRSIDPDWLAQEVATRLVGAMPVTRYADADALAELREVITARDQFLAAEQVRLQARIERLQAEVHRTEHTMQSALRNVAETQHRAVSNLEGLQVGLDSTARTLGSLQRELDGQGTATGREVARVGENLQDDLRMLGRRVEAQIQGAASRVQQSPESSEEVRRLAAELSGVTERLDSLVSYLDASVDVRSLGRLSRTIERTVLSLGLPLDTATDADNAKAGRRRRRTSATENPLHLVDHDADAPPAAGAGA